MALRVPRTVQEYFVDWIVKNIGGYLGARLYYEVKTAISPYLSGVPAKVVPWVVTQVIAVTIDNLIRPITPRWRLFKDAIVIGAFAAANHDVGRLPTVSELILARAITSRVIRASAQMSPQGQVVVVTRTAQSTPSHSATTAAPKLTSY